MASKKSTSLYHVEVSLLVTVMVEVESPNILDATLFASSLKQKDLIRPAEDTEIYTCENNGVIGVVASDPSKPFKS